MTKEELEKIAVELNDYHLRTSVEERRAGYKAWYKSVAEKYGDEGARFAAILLAIQKSHEEVVVAENPQKQLTRGTWLLIAGGVCAVVFVVILIVAFGMGTLTPDQRRIERLFAAGFGGLMATCFTGGLTVRGMIPLPLAKKHPLAVSATNGFGVFVLVWVLF